ncbi:DUF4136 domain-containing protein [Flavobacteriaceae bacterium TK19130]|nr:DUF4136 domain-containing protein [Thermobacterium salinum]
MKYFIGLFLLVSTSSCFAPTSIYYEVNSDVSGFSTYNFYPVLDTNLAEDETKRIMQIIDLELYKADFQKSESPDFYVNFFAEENTTYVPIYNDSIPRQNDSITLKTVAVDQLLYLDVVNVEKDELAWTATIEGTLQDTLSEGEVHQYYVGKITEALQSFEREVKNEELENNE